MTKPKTKRKKLRGGEYIEVDMAIVRWRKRLKASNKTIGDSTSKARKQAEKAREAYHEAKIPLAKKEWF